MHIAALNRSDMLRPSGEIQSAEVRIAADPAASRSRQRPSDSGRVDPWQDRGSLAGHSVGRPAEGAAECAKGLLWQRARLNSNLGGGHQPKGRARSFERATRRQTSTATARTSCLLISVWSWRMHLQLWRRARLEGRFRWQSPATLVMSGPMGCQRFAPAPHHPAPPPSCMVGGCTIAGADSPNSSRIPAELGAARGSPVGRSSVRHGAHRGMHTSNCHVMSSAPH